MATPLNTIFSWFETGDFPTQAQFQASWSSFWHKDDLVPISQITGLTQVIEQMASSEALQNHINDSNAHAGYLAKLDASNLATSHVNNWKEKLGVGEIPANVALVDMGENQSVFNKEQITSICMLLENYVNSNGKIMSGMIEALGLTELIPVNEFTLEDFITNHSVYDFQINDIIAIPSSNPGQGYRLYFYNGGDKTSQDSYLATGLSNITIAMVQGLQAALDGKMNKPTASGNYYARHFSGQVSWAAINPASSYLLYWNGNDFIGSGIYTDGTKFGIGTTSPTEMLHLNNGRIRTKAMVFDENTESLPNQITLANRRFHGADLTGSRRMFMYRDYDDHLALIQSFSQVQKDALGSAWNNQYSNGSLNVYSITPTVMKNDHIVRYLVLQGLNLNVNPLSTAVKFIPVGNALGVGEIDCLGFQTFADGKSLVVSAYGDSLQAGIQYNIVIRTTSPTTQTHRTTSSINVVVNINSIDVSNLNWQVKSFTSGLEGTIFTTNGGLFGYSSSTDNKAYAFEPNTIVGAIKSDLIFPASSNFYLEMNMSLGITWTNTPSDINDFYGYLGLINSSLPIALADNSFLRIINSNFRSGFYNSVMVYNNIVTNTTKIEVGASVLNANIIIMRTGNIYTQFLTVGNTMIVQSASSTTEAVSLSLAVTNGTTKKSINASIVQAFTF